MWISGAVRAYVCGQPVDLRKAIDGLADLVGPLFEANPLSGHLFVFLSKDRTKVKILYWDRHGFALWYKRLERGHFPRPQELAGRGLSLPELSAWLEGIDVNRGRPLAPVAVSRVA